MNFKIHLLNTYLGFVNEDLILSFLLRNYSCELVTNISEANIVIRGVFPARLSLFRRGISVLSNKLNDILNNASQLSVRQLVDPGRRQLWIHISGEKPNLNTFSSFYNSECDIGIGHETINNNNYVRMPNWYQSIDWADSGVPRDQNAYYRFGKPISLDELTTGISSASFSKNKQNCALINSHLTAPRDLFCMQIKKIMPLDIYGQVGLKTDQCKRDILKNYNFNLAPENTLYPGYVTEKIPEAYACGVFPIGWYLDGVDKEFSEESHLNLATFGPYAFCVEDDSLHSALQEIVLRTAKEGVPPLLPQKPSLDPMIALIERAIGYVKY